jgi:hypothetical protein
MPSKLRAGERVVDASEWIATLHERYAPHDLPPEVIRVAEAEAEDGGPFRSSLASTVDLPETVIRAAGRVRGQAGLRVDMSGRLIVDDGARPDADMELRHLYGVLGREPGAPVALTRLDTPDVGSTDVKSGARSRKRDPFALPPKADPNEPAEDTGAVVKAVVDAGEKGVTTAGTPGGRQIVTRAPEREADYRKALHDTTRQQLSANALLAGLVICQRCWQSGELYATQSTVAEWMHLASAKSVRKALAELEEAGFLTRTGDPIPKRVYHYRLTIPIGWDETSHRI